MVSVLRDIHVERDEHGALLVRWRADGAIDIGIGASPLASEHTPLATAVEGGLFRIDEPPSERAYVSLVAPGRSAVVAAERRVPFEGITNLRDLGGYLDRLRRDDALGSGVPRRRPPQADGGRPRRVPRAGRDDGL